MKTDNPITENTMICDFMGFQHSTDPNMDKYEMERLDYHKSWSSLMPVVEKIENLEGCFEIIIRATHAKAHSFNPFNLKIIHIEAIEGEEFSKITAVYKCSVAFIKWYNTTRPK